MPATGSTETTWCTSIDSRPSPTASHGWVDWPLASVPTNLATDDSFSTVSPLLAAVTSVGSVTGYGRTLCS